MADSGFALEVVGVDKWFGANHANRAVSFQVRRGAIHGLVGENGAGKSTIMNVVYGYLPADGGEIRVQGRPLRIHRPADAIAAGIGMVHQHFMLVEAFTAVENLLLGSEGGGLLAGGTHRARAELARLARDYGLEVEPDRPVGELPVGARQRLEIIKALFRGAEILILDEPTAVLTPQEADRLFALLRALKAEGKTVIVITHKLREIIQHTDQVTVMRRGRAVATLDAAATSADELARLMVGRNGLAATTRAPATPGAAVLTVKGLWVRDDAGRDRVRGVDLTLRAGEIVGIAGVSGNGQSELLEALAGMRPTADGEVWLGERKLTAEPAVFTPRGLRRLGVAHAPEDRQRVGLVTALPAYAASILGYHDDRRWNGRWRLLWGEVKRRCAAAMAAFDIRPAAPDLPAGGFSGGNQQKIVLAREIGRDPALLLVGQPTRGVDIGAVAHIHQRILALRAAGKAILLVSTELDEILALSDRVLVMFDGRIAGETAPEQADDRLLGLLMAGANPVEMT